MIFLKFAPVEFQIVQRRGGGDLAEAVHIVAVADLVQRGDECGMTDKITHAAESRAKYAL